MSTNCRCCHDDVRVLFMLIVFLISLAAAGTINVPQTFTTRAGSSVMLPCFVSASSTEVSWTFKSSKDARSASEDVFRNSQFANAWLSRADRDPVMDGDFSLILLRVSANDAGLYTCDVGRETAVARRYLLTLSDSIDKNLTLVDAEYGQDVAFSCWLANASLIRWQHTLPEFPADPVIVHNGRRPSQNYSATGRYHYYLDASVHRSVLLINMTDQSDAGTFKCSPSYTSVQTYWEFRLSFQGSNYSQPEESVQTPVPACSVGDACNPATTAAIACASAIMAAAISVAVTYACLRRWHFRKRDSRPENVPLQRVKSRSSS